LFEEVQKSVGDRLQDRTRHQNILQPLLWLSGTFGGVCAVAATRAEGLLQQELFSMTALCGVVTIAAYIFWAIKDPDRLQTETYRLSNRQLDIYERRGIPSKGGLINDPDLLVVTAGDVLALSAGATQTDRAGDES
jgi:hypothetical protein